MSPTMVQGVPLPWTLCSLEKALGHPEQVGIKILNLKVMQAFLLNPKMKK